MGCCGSDSTKTKKNKAPNIKNTNNNTKNETINPTEIQIIPDISEKQNKFIEQLFSKELKPNVEENRKSIFIKFQKKKIKIIKDLIQVEDEITLTTRTGPNNYNDTFWYLINEQLNKIKSRQIYIDGKKVDDSNFETDGKNIQFQFEPLFNEQTRNIKIIYEYPYENPNYIPVALYFKDSDIVAQVVIYTDNDYQIDDVNNNKYTF